MLIFVNHGQVIVDHNCLENCKRDNTLGSKVPINILKVFQNHISKPLFAFEKLLSQSCHKTRQSALLPDRISEVISGYLMALISIECIEETLKDGIVWHFARPGAFRKLKRGKIVLVSHVHMVNVDLLELIKVDISGVLFAVAIYETFSFDSLSLQSGGFVDFF